MTAHPLQKFGSWSLRLDDTSPGTKKVETSPVIQLRLRCLSNPVLVVVVVGGGDDDVCCVDVDVYC